MTRLGLVIEHAGLASTDDQRVTLASAGVDRVVALAPRTQEDWHYRIREALDDLGDEDAVVVTALTSLGLGAAALLDGIAAVREQDVRLVSLAEGLDTDAAPDFLPGVALLTRAIEAGASPRPRRSLRGPGIATRSPRRRRSSSTGRCGRRPSTTRPPSSAEPRERPGIPPVAQAGRRGRLGACHGSPNESSTPGRSGPDRRCAGPSSP
jgi:hypothetical protein